MSNNEQKGNVSMDGHWHLDKRVPLALIFTILAQTFTFGWVMSNFDGRISALEQDNKDLKEIVRTLSEVPIHLQYMKGDISEIKTFLQEEVEWTRPKSGG